ncbi:MAG TPA: hypothetical protein VMW27_04900, partial [Thermoanaerobaculia bacterium]|nr:hypothetical protein [Thermoanaerobaculia bacterium]
EQVDARPGVDAVDHRADLYAAGVIFHEMLTGRAPGGKFALPSQLSAELPPEVDVVVMKCLSRDPRQRYTTAIDLLNDLARLEESLRLRLHSELKGISQAGSKLLGGGGQAGETGSKRGVWIVAAALLLAALTVIAYLFTR